MIYRDNLFLNVRFQEAVQAAHDQDWQTFEKYSFYDAKMMEDLLYKCEHLMHLEIKYACKELHLTQSELVRRVLYGVNVKHTVVVAQGGEDALAALAALSAQCSKVGSNLNQLARHFNSGGKDTEQLRAQILEELSALTNFRLKAEETVGELYGNHQAFKLEEL